MSLTFVRPCPEYCNEIIEVYFFFDRYVFSAFVLNVTYNLVLDGKKFDFNIVQMYIYFEKKDVG